MPTTQDEIVIYLNSILNDNLTRKSPLIFIKTPSSVRVQSNPLMGSNGFILSISKDFLKIKTLNRSLHKNMLGDVMS